MIDLRSLSRRDIIAIAFASVIAAGCVGLGFWQLDRLEQRRASNATIQAAMRAPAVALGTLGASPRRLTRVSLVGSPDYRHEFALTGRTRSGSPGVHIITPFRLPGRDTAVLVNRGWVYSPDASQVDFARWKEGDVMTVSGFIDTLSSGRGTAGSPVQRLRQLEHHRIAAQLPYPIAYFYVVAIVEGTTGGTDTPVRLPLPALEEGPHKSYAIQWFSFAAIALVGTAAFLASSRTRPT